MGLNPLFNVSQCEEKSTKCIAWLSFMTSVQGLLPNILEVTRDTLKTMQNQLWSFKFGVQIFLFVCFKGLRQWYACRLTNVSVFTEIPNGRGTPP